MAPKDKLKLRSGVKTLHEKSQVSMPQSGKMFSAPPTLPKAGRKALEAVNRATEKTVKTNRLLKQRQPAFTVTRPSRLLRVKALFLLLMMSIQE